MKRVILLIGLFLIVATAYSQLPQREGRRGAEFSYIEKQENTRFQQIQSARIAFFTTEMELTPAEAEDFWPLYNKLWKEKEAAHNAAQKALKEISRHIKGEKKLASEAELKTLMVEYVESNAAVGAIDMKYQAEFLTIISVEKLAKFYKSEEDFRMRMIHQLRRDPEKPEKPGDRNRGN